MAFSYAITTQVAGEVTITVPFPFEAREDVRVYVDDVLLTEGDAEDYVWNTDSEVLLAVAPTVGLDRKVQRFTDITEVAAVFSIGAIDHRDLNEMATQLLYAAQEAYDRSALAGEGAAIASGVVNDSSVSGATVKDALETLAAFLGFTTENAQDAIGSILTDTAEVNFTYNDTLPAITADLNDNSVVAARLKATTTKRVFGRRTASSGAGEEITASQVLDFIGSTQGQVLVRGASTWAVLAAGADGLVLTAGGPGVNPAWEASPAGYTDEQAQDAVGAMATSSARVTFTYDDGVPSLTPDLVLDSITAGYAHFAATQRLFGRHTALAGAGEEVTMAQAFSWVGNTRGDIFYRGVGGWTALAIGTVGLPLLAGGAGSDPSYAQVGTAGIAADAVTYAKIQNISAQYRVLGRITAAAGDSEELTPQNVWTVLQQVAFTGGITASEFDNGTKTATWKPDPANGNMQKVGHNGTYTLTPPDAAGVYTIILAMTNGASAGVLTTSGFTKVNGDALTTTNGHKFNLTIVKNAVGTKLTVEAMQ